MRRNLADYPLRAWWGLAAGLAFGVVVATLAHPLWATAAFSGSLLAAGVARALLPNDLAGGLVVRRRTVDVSMLVALGLAVGIIGWSMNLHPNV